MAVILMHLAHCGGQSLSAHGSGGSDATVDGSQVADAAEEPPTCAPDSGWQCAVDTSCLAPTTLTGKVFDPAGLTPLPGVVVFVPTFVAQLPPITTGNPSCGFPTIGAYVVIALTDATGSFVLTGVPVGSAVPVTVQTGKWRRTVALNVSNACATTTVPDGTLRLPGRRADGDMPQMALLTGGADNLACFLTDVGIDASEFSAPGGGGRVAVYRGVGGADLSNGAPGDCTTGACPLWGTTATLDAYDMLLLGCEGAANLQTKPASATLAMHDWLTGGGKLFGVHSEDTWFSNGPVDFRGVANWVDGPEAGATGPFSIDTSFPRGLAFQRWASAAGILEADGGLPLLAPDVATSVAGVNGRTVGWIHDDSTARLLDGSSFAGNVKALTFGIPTGLGEAGAIAEPSACGTAVLTDIHPGGTALRSPIPSACAGSTLTPEEKALEFLFFDNFNTTAPTCGCLPPPPPIPDDGG
jgi:hypothetical protein